MTKFIITLAALGALSTSAFAAGNRNNELRDVDAWVGTGAQAETSAFIVTDAERASNNFERLNWNMEKNESSSH